MLLLQSVAVLAMVVYWIWSWSNETLSVSILPRYQHTACLALLPDPLAADTSLPCIFRPVALGAFSVVYWSWRGGRPVLPPQHEPLTDGGVVSVKANPSQAEAIYKDFKAKKAKLVTKKKVDVSERYGNAAAADKPDDELLLGQTEAYREYDASGGHHLHLRFCGST